MEYIIPVILAVTIIISIRKKQPSYENFIDGANDGMKITLSIFPSLVAILSAAYMLRESGAIDILIKLLSPITNFLHIPPEVMPLSLIRPVSGSGALGLLADNLNTYGADSEIGKISSIIMGSTETTFYCLCVYFAKTKVKYTKRAIPCAVLGDIVGIIAAVLIIKLVNF